MEWYEWVFDGIGTTLIAALSSFIGYKSAIKNISKQSQVAGEHSKQKQEIVIENASDAKSMQNSIKQTQKAGNSAEQTQCGGFKIGE